MRVKGQGEDCQGKDERVGTVLGKARYRPELA